MSLKSLIIKNTIISGSSQVVNTLIQFFLTPYLILKLGATGFGFIALSRIFKIDGYVSLLEFGLQSTITRFYGEFSQKESSTDLHNLKWYGLIYLSFIGMITSLVGFFFVDFLVDFLNIPKSYLLAFVIAIKPVFLSLIFQFPRFALVGILEGKQRLDVVNGANSIKFILYGIGCLTILELGFSWESIILWMVICEFFSFLILAYFVFRKSSFHFSLLKEVNSSFFIEILKVTKYVFLSRLSGIVFNQTDLILIGMYLDPKAVGAYEVIVRLPRLIRLITGIGNSAIMPASSSISNKKNPEVLNTLFRNGLNFNLYLSLPIVFISIFFSEEFLLAWVGPDFSSYSSSLNYLLIWILFFPLGVGWSILFGQNELIKRSTQINVLGTIIKFITGLALVKKLGVHGIALSYLFPQVVIIYIIPLFFKRFNVDYEYFLKKISSLLLLFIPVFTLMKILSSISYASNLFHIAVYGTLSLLLYWALIYKFGLEDEEKTFVGFLIQKIKFKFLKYH